MIDTQQSNPDKTPQQEPCVLTVVAAIDPGKPCAHALQASWGLSKHFQESGKLPLALLHAVEVAPSLWPGLDEETVFAMNHEALEAARSQMRSFCREHLPELGEAELDQSLTVLPGSASQVLTQFAEESAQPALLVMGKHRRRGVFDFGSALRSVLALSAAPMWIQAEAPTETRQILVAIDMSEHSAVALSSAIRFAQSFGAELEAVHFLDLRLVASGNAAMFPEAAWPSRIEDVRKATRVEFEAFLKNHDPNGVVSRASVVENTPVTGLLERAADRSSASPIDLLVLGTHGRGALARTVLGSVANDVLRETTLPVLVVPNLPS